MRAVLFCGILLGCGSKPLPFPVPESGEYELTTSVVELTCPDYLNGLELGQTSEATIQIEFFDDEGVRFANWPLGACTHLRGTVACQTIEEVPGKDSQTDTYWFHTQEVSVSWDSSIQGSGWQTARFVCEGDDCDEYLGDCAEAYVKRELEFVKFDESGEGDTALAE